MDTQIRAYSKETDRDAITAILQNSPSHLLLTEEELAQVSTTPLKYAFDRIESNKYNTHVYLNSEGSVAGFINYCTFQPTVEDMIEKQMKAIESYDIDKATAEQMKQTLPTTMQAFFESKPEIFAPQGHIEIIGVSKTHLRQGIASALMTAALANMFSQEPAPAFIKAFIKETNTPSQALFAKFGFEQKTPIPGHRTFYQLDAESYLLSTQLV